MKRYINELPVVIDVEISVDHPILHVENSYVAASVDLSEFDLPNGPVISKNKKYITQVMVDDFESFMDYVEILCEETYGLIGVYKHVSSDHSHYYNYLAKDNNGNIIVKLRLRLRISNHLAKRSKSQKWNKKNELNSEKLHELLSDEEIAKLDVYPKSIIINSEVFDSYESAMKRVNSVISHAVEVMKSKSNH